MINDTPRPQLIVHVGFHKTGSSTVQMALSAQSDMPGAGFHYPCAGRLAHWPHAHHQLIEDLRHGRADSLKALASEVTDARAPLTVISCEDLATIENARLMGHIRSAFPDHEVRALAVVRPHVDWLRSMYLERVKRGVTILAPMDYFREHRERLRYAPILDTIAQTGCTVEVLDYAGLDLPGDLVASLTGAPLSAEVRKHQNVSLSARMSMVMLDQFRNGGGQDVDVHTLIHNAYDLDRKCRAVAPAADIFDAEQIRRIHAFYAEDRRMLSERFGLPYAADDPAPVPKGEAVRPGPHNLPDLMRSLLTAPKPAKA